MRDAERPHLLGSAYKGGIETRPGILRLVIKAIILHVPARQRAQKEIDNVVGPDRLPSFEDMSRMPYMNAFIKLLVVGGSHSC